MPRPMRALRAALPLLAAAALAASAAPPPRVARPAPHPAPLPALRLDPGSLTVSGVSSGGYMATQFQVAFSASTRGAGVIAGGPYGCTRGALSTAVTACSCPPAASAWQAWLQRLPLTGCAVPAPSVLATFADEALARNAGFIDDPAHLAGQRVWLLTGGQDTVVPSPLVQSLAEFYQRRGVPPAALHLERVPAATHGQPSPDAPLACGTLASPFLLRCPGEDAAGQLLQWLYAPPGEPALTSGTPRAAGLRAFDQRPYRQRGVFDGLDDAGWLYVPAACEAPGAGSGAGCRLHIVFHGCGQGRTFVSGSGPFKGQAIGRRVADAAGYHRWAEANRIVVLYPQVKASTLPASAVAAGRSHQLNPDGCWDFWGYTDPDGDIHGVQRHFARRTAPQLRAVKAMADALLAGPR